MYIVRDNKGQRKHKIKNIDRRKTFRNSYESINIGGQFYSREMLEGLIISLGTKWYRYINRSDENKHLHFVEGSKTV